MQDSEIWLVTIDLPIKYINRGMHQLDDIIQKDIEDTNAELADAYAQEVPPEEEMPQDDISPEGMEGMEDEMPPEEEL
jgi:hypothetical protein